MISIALKSAMIDLLKECSSKYAKDALEELKRIEGDRPRFRSWILRLGSKASEIGAHIQNTDTILEKVILPAYKFVLKNS